MKKHDIMPGFINQIYIVLALALIGFSGSLATKCVSMSHQSCMVKPI